MTDAPQARPPAAPPGEEEPWISPETWRKIRRVAQVFFALVLLADLAAIAFYVVQFGLEPGHIYSDEVYLWFREYGDLYLGIIAWTMLVALSIFVHWLATFILLALATLGAVPLVGYSIYIAYWDPFCEDQRTADFVTEDGRFRILREELNCGDTVPPLFRVYVREAGDRWTRQSKIFDADELPVPDEIRYAGDGRIVIGYFDTGSIPQERKEETVVIDPETMLPDKVMHFIHGARNIE